MPDLRNEPPDGDHDKLIDVSSRLGKVEDEIVNLRDWRHNQITPVVTIIQAQQRTNADHIGRLTENVEKIAVSQAALSHLAGDLADHRSDDRAAFREVGDSLKGVHEKLETNSKAVGERLDKNNTERNEAHKKLLYWVAGLVIAGLAAVVGLQWAFISPHLVWHP